MALVMFHGLATARAATTGSTYGFVGSFGSSDLSPGSDASQTAVETSTGRIMVVDPNTGSVKVFDPDPTVGGTALTSFAVVSLIPGAIAADPTNGSVYVSDGLFGGITKYDSDGAPVPTYTQDATYPSTPTFGGGGTALAVDPATHDLLIADPGQGVLRVDPTGTVTSTFTGADTGNGAFEFPESIAVGPNGDIYVVDIGGSGRLERFSSAGVSLGKIATTGKPRAVAVNPTTGEVIVGEDLGTTKRPRLEGFTPTGVPTFIARYPAAATNGTNRGLAVNGGGRIYATTDDPDTSGAGGSPTPAVNMFDSALQPGVDPPVISQLTPSGAHVAAAVATGAQATTGHIEYCPATADCADFAYSDAGDPSNPWLTLPDQSVTTTLEDDVTGLDPNQTYEVRAYVANSATENISSATSFTTLPAPANATTASASEVHLTDAVLNGSVDPRGAQTTYHFEFGTTTAYGSRSPANFDAVAGNGRVPRAFSRTVTGLAPGTTYHFRIVAQNAAGTSYGVDKTFATAATAEPVRGYEQVTPVDKAGGAINPTYGFQAKSDGSAIEYGMAAAPAGAPSSVEVPRMMSVRGSADWSQWSFLDPPIGVTRTALGTATAAVSSDFQHVMVVSNRALAPGAAEGAANIYVKDLASGSYTFVGSSTTAGALGSMIGLQQARLFLAGASDFSWLVLSSNVPLLPGAPNVALYKWTAQGGLTLQSRLPNGGVPTGDLDQITPNQPAVRYVSDDGSTMYFALRSGERGVYRRSGGQTTAISVSRIPGDPTTPQPGHVAGVSRDGDDVVFVSGRLLAAAPVGDENLYRYQASTDSLVYLGTVVTNADPTNILAVSDDAQIVYYNDGTNTVVSYDGATRVVTGQHPEPGAYASNNGRFLVWVGSDGDVRRYDAVADSTICVSCRADGTPGGNALLSDPERNISNRRPNVVSDQGVVFFTTSTRLLTADRNGSRDVYMYSDGAVHLISPGTGEFDANYADSSDDGHDVFFTTTQGIVGQDQDGEPDVYDARIAGGIPGQSPTPAVSCQKSTCGPATSGPVTSPPVVAQPQPFGPQSARTNQVKVKVSLRKLSFTSKAMHVTFAATQHGRVRVTGTNIVITVRDVKRAGTYSIVVPLSKKARALKRHHKRFKVTAKVAFTAGWSTASFKINRTLRG